MSAVELKSNIHKIVERIQNEQFLQILYDFLIAKENVTEGKLWASLTKEQKEEVLLSFEDSENVDNLIPAENIFKRKK